MQTIHVIYTFFDSHPIIGWILLSILIVSIARIPPPTNPVLYFFWSVLVRITFLSWDRWGGGFKFPGTIYPDPATLDEDKSDEHE